ncbi:MAG: hypothetical protein JXN10_05045 [Clostridia bacterium]|nr:hypothetical protein [Clostridia bacterium]MBN2882872.1 hypothetical protein [Clostridia bacterium]
METLRIYDMIQFIDFSRRMAKGNKNFIEVREIAHTGNFPVIAFFLTDFSVSTSDKQNVLFTAMHSGIEYSGANTLFRLIEILLDESDSSLNFLRKYQIVIAPVVNPYSYEIGGLENQYRTEFSCDPYSDPWSVDGIADPSLNVEAAAIQALIDEFRPELFIDCHGVFFKGQHMIENTGVSVHGMSRPHNEIFVNKINDASKEMGYHSEYLELRQKSLPVIPELAGRKYQTCSQKINACVYAYHNYHTLAMVMEIGFVESGLARLIRALELGLIKWDGEIMAGFPVNRVFGEGLEGLHPCSSVRDKRRLERVTLWNNMHNYSYAVLYPQIPGRETYALLHSKPTVPAYETVPEDSYLVYNPGIAPKLPDCPFSISFKIPFLNASIKKITVNGKNIPVNLWEWSKYDGFSLVFVKFPDGIDKETFVTVTYNFNTGASTD